MYPRFMLMGAAHAVGSAVGSRVGIADRWAYQKATLGTGRWVTAENHDRCYSGMAATADRIDHGRHADVVLVIRRGGEVVYGNRLVSPDGPWFSAPSTRAALETERSRTWTSAELSAFRRQTARVAAIHQTDPKFQNEMAAVRRLEPRSALTSSFPVRTAPTRPPTHEVAPSLPPSTEHRRPGPGR